MNKKLALKLGIQTYQILTNDDEICIPSLSSILLAVVGVMLLVQFLISKFEKKNIELGKTVFKKCAKLDLSIFTGSLLFYKYFS